MGSELEAKRARSLYWQGSVPAVPLYGEGRNACGIF